MLTHRGLIELSEALKDKSVLSVYVNGQVEDPARRRQWRIELRHALDDVETWLNDSPHAVREDFASRRALVESRLDALGTSIRAPGWVGFYTSEGEYEAGPLPVTVPTMAIWSTGPSLAPYIRAMKEARPVLVAVADQESIRVYRYAGRETAPVETLRSRKIRGQGTAHFSRPARQGFHQPTRGPTGTDVAQRERQAATERLLHDFVGHVSRYAGSDCWLVIGGTPSMATALLASLPANLAARAVRARVLDVHATRAQVAEAAREGASHLRGAEDLRRVTKALASAESDGRGAVGSADTLRALDEGNVRELFFTERFLHDHASEAETAVRLGLQHQAFVEQVSAEAAERLDDAGGIAGRLRFPARVATMP